MNILGDLLLIVPGRNRETETYGESLLKEMKHLPDTNRVCLTDSCCYRNEIGLPRYAAPISGYDRLIQLLSQQTAMGFVARRTKADMLFCPSCLAPVSPTLPAVVIIRDTNFREVPTTMP